MGKPNCPRSGITVVKRGERGMRGSAESALESRSARRGGASRRSRLLLPGVLLLMTAVLYGCSSSSTSSSTTSTAVGTPITGGTATFAEPPETPPNWIFPFVSPAVYTFFGDNQWDWEMWRPLYFVGTPTSPDINFDESLANPPVFTDNNTVITITLKPWRWSDGTPITARNVLFFFNMLKAEKDNWWLYIPGTFPDDVVSASIPSQRVIQFKLTHSYNPAYFTQNELQSLTPLPLAWDRTSLSGSRGSGSTLPAGTGNGLDMTTAGAKAVYNFLIAQNKDLSTYASNWLWQITSGPFKLKTYAVNGASTMVPNPYYGGVKPKISVLSYVPFTSASSEFLALASGSSGIDVGYTSYADIARQSLLANYQLEPWPSWAVTTLYLNFNNPKVGAIFNQQYIRVALQSLIDEPLIVKDVYHGYASVTMGPVPLTPASAYLTSYLSSFPYPYDPSKAISLLTSHGWAVHPQGTTTCQRPGSASNECGAGIASGSALNFTLTYSSAEPETQVMHIQEKTNFSAAGVVLNLHPVIPATLFASVGACTSSQPLCSWQIGEFQDNAPFPNPIPAAWCQTGSLYNFGSYSNSQLDQYIEEAVRSSDSSPLSSALANAENLATKDVCFLSEPSTPYQLSEIAKNLRGVTPQSPEYGITPEMWYFVRS